MNLFTEILGLVREAVAALVADGTLPDGLALDAISVEPPRDPDHGDIATNAAMALAKPARRNPKEIATALAAKLEADPRVTSAEVAGPGFVNLRLDRSIWLARLGEVLAEGPDYGRSTLGEGAKVNVEYVSANPTGPLHVGHCRGAVFGDALANLLAFAGWDVTREYYINDGGAQVDVLARSAYLRYREALGEAIGEIPEGLYPGDYLVPVGQALAARDGDKWLKAPEAEWLPAIRDFAVAQMMDLIREDLAVLSIRHDVFSSEKAVYDGRIDAGLAALDAQGLIYTGVLEPPKGKAPEDWEPRPQVLFRASQFGDDTDRPLKKSDGSWTYFAADIAYHYDKVVRGFGEMIDVFGADHGGYVKRMKAAVAGLTAGKAALDIKLVQLVKLFRGGEPYKMSKRAGTFVTLRDVVDEVGPDVVRFMMLMRKNDAPLDFDFVSVTEQSKENPVFYVQYAHARVRSVMRQAAETMPGVEQGRAALAAADFARLESPHELALIKRLVSWPRTVESAASAHEPHRIAFALYDLAAELHGLWNRGKDDASLRFLVADDPALTAARLALIQAVADVIAAGLGILGVVPAEEMR